MNEKLGGKKAGVGKIFREMRPRTVGESMKGRKRMLNKSYVGGI